MSKLPKHANPTREDRTAIAPYNFVELPDEVVSAEIVAPEERVPPEKDKQGNIVREFPYSMRQNTYHTSRHTGRIECTLTTSSPLYVRCALTLEQFKKGEDERQHPPDNYREAIKNTPDFFYTHDKEQPVIPGSSLRGMLRTLVEIVSFGKIDKVTKEKLFFRTFDDSVIGESYRKRMVGNVRGGFLKMTGYEAIIEECRVYRIERQLIRDKISPHLHEGKRPNLLPKWSTVQHIRVWVQVKDFDSTDPANFGNVLDISLQEQHEQGWIEGILVLSGDAPQRKGAKEKREFVFIKQANSHQRIVEEATLKRFHDDDQITRWQQDAFPKDKPRKKARERHGMLSRNIENPVFFLVDENAPHKVEFFGRASMFRLPYLQSPHNLVPEQQNKELDIAEVLFGYVDAEKNQSVLAGRVFVTDGTFVAAKNQLWLTEENDRIITPHILGGPKPTSFQHYLVQNEDGRQPRANNSKRLSHYDSPTPSQTVIRGHKLYWHQGVVGKDDIEDTSTGGDTQRTQFKPINAGVSFTFTIHFENLSDVELGVLLWVLDIASQEKYRLKLGMGKPLGMGAVKIEHFLHLTDRVKRYTTLFNETGNQWEYGTKEDGSIAETEKKALAAFECAILRNEVINPPNGKTRTYQRIAQIPRIQSLLRMLYWKDDLEDNEKSARKYMELGGFRSRPVLPTPEGVASNSDDVLPDPTADVLGDMDLLEKTLIAPVSKPVETRRLGIIARAATSSESGLLEDTNGKKIPYGHNDIIGAAPGHQQKVLFRKTRKKQGKKNKNLPWAEDVEGKS